MSDVIRHHKFSVKQTLWELWTFLERNNVKDVFVEDEEPSSDPNYVEIFIRERGRIFEALIKLPKDYLESYYLMNIMKFFEVIYRDFNAYLDGLIDAYAEVTETEVNDLLRKIIPTSPPVESLRKEILGHIKNCICYHPHNLLRKTPFFNFFDYSLETLYKTYRRIYEEQYA
jgi:hypothetical protein